MLKVFIAGLGTVFLCLFLNGLGVFAENAFNETLSTNNTNFFNSSTNKTDVDPGFNLTIPLNLFNNETIAALNGTVFNVANGTNATTIRLNSNDQDSGDLRYLLSGENSSCARPYSDYLLLSIQWPAVLCSTGYCKTNSKQNWTIHGLWPSVRDYSKRTNAEYCCSRESFDENKLEHLRNRLSVSSLSINTNDY